MNCTRALAFAILAGVVLVAGCRGADVARPQPPLDTIMGSPSRTVTVAEGADLDVVLGTIGPGYYAVPPTVSSSVIRFLNETGPSVSTPGGGSETFHFAAVASGRAVIAFDRAGDPPDMPRPDVYDTIVVR